MTQPEIVDIAERIAEHFPLGGYGDHPFALEVVPGATGRWVRGTEPAAVATIRLIHYGDPASDRITILDIKEQEVPMGWPAYYDETERVAAFFAALGAIIAELGARGVDPSAEGLMPADLLRADVLKLRSANTIADFDAALRAKSRLGLLFR